MTECICGYNIVAHMARHKRTCKVKKVTEKLLQENEQLRNEITELKARLDECRNSRPNVQNNVTINIVPYGREEPLTNAQVRSILSSIPSESVPRYIEMKHFRRPESSNIRITNKRGRTLQIVEEDSNKRLRWVDKDRKTMLSAITDSSLEELIDQFDAEKYKIWNDWFETSGLKDEGYDKTDAFKEIMSKVENMITSQSPKNVLT